MAINLSKLQEMVKDRGSVLLQFTGLQRVIHDLVTNSRGWKRPLGGSWP